MPVTKETILSVVREIDPNVGTYEHHGQLSILVSAQHIVEVCRELRDNPQTQFNLLIDITAIDWLKKKDRYDVVYFLQSIPLGGRVRIKVAVQEKYPYVPSVCEVWEGANWYERETFDMYGIRFEGHPDMRRFYMPEDYVDPQSGEPIYPMRKDFPVMGIEGSLPLPPFPEKNGGRS